MEKITSQQWRDLDVDGRAKILNVGRSRYRIDTYVGPLVAAGLAAIDRMTPDAIMPVFDEDDRDAEIAAYRAIDAQRNAALAESLSEWVDAAKSQEAEESVVESAVQADSEVAIAPPKKRKKKQPTPPKADYARVCGEMINWPHQFRALVPWAGNQSLIRLLGARLLSLAEWDQSCDALDYEAPLNGVSGIMPGHRRINALDMGFSPDGMKIIAHPYREICILIGVQFAPILKLATDRFAVQWADEWYSWKILQRVAPYYFAWEPEVGLPVISDCRDF